jgi:hypothetical protein
MTFFRSEMEIAVPDNAIINLRALTWARVTGNPVLRYATLNDASAFEESDH